MASGNSRKNIPAEIVLRIRRIFGHNIATIVFSVIFLYVVLSAVFYMNANHIESYQVTSGPLSRNETYTGLAIREENVVQADSSGYITYYAREGDKINANGAVFGLSSTRIPEVTTRLSQEDLQKIRDQMLSFSKGFDSAKFNKTYSFKYQLEGSILQYAGATGQSSSAPLTSEELDEYAEEVDSSDSVTLGNQTINKAEADGIILYAEDGYEDVTMENITEEDFDQNSYHETDLKTEDPVKAGDDVYTIITDERWSLLIPLSDKQAVKLQDRPAIRVKFLKDDMTQSGDFSIVKIGDGKYGKIDFSKGLIRYASERFLDIELVCITVTGLKIPLSAIVTKEFYTIPSTFATTGADGASEGFLVATRNSNGKTETTMVTPMIYARIENPKKKTLGADDDSTAKTTYTYYVDQTAFEEGDALVTTDSEAKYIIGETAALEGVYCINQGYAVFRRIQILDQNEEYAIIAKGTTYGLTRYDHIVKNADKVKEEDILY